MACFLVPAGEAIVTTLITKVIEAKEKAGPADMPENTAASRKTLIAPKLKWLNNMLWGGSALLMLEHIWHGEVVPWFPFLTAAADPADTAEMLSEMSTVGVTMALAVTGVWAVTAAVSYVIEKRTEPTDDEAERESAV